MPPRHGKTLTTSTLFPAWYLGRDSSRSVAIATYGESLAKDLGRKVQQTVSDPLHCAIFPESRLAADVGAAERLEFEAGGSFFAVSRQGSLTGRGCDLLICDDLLKDQNEARSAAIRRSIIDFYERVAVSRLTPEGAIVLVGTRWGKGDLFDYLLDERGEDQWTVLNLPAVAEENDLLGRVPGEALWPEKYSVKHLAHKRYEMGTSAFVCLYQGHPAESEGLIFKREWWRTYTQLPELKRTILSVDSAFKTGLQNDYSAIQVWGESQTGFYLLTAWKQRVAFPDLKRSLATFADQWKPSVILIEDAASGQSLIQELQTTTSLPIKPIKVDRDKESRASACTGLLESGRVFVPADAPWLADFLDELSSFPNAPHDDQVDSCTMALNFLRGGSGVLGIVEWLKGIASGIFSPDGELKQVSPQLAAKLEPEITTLKPMETLVETLPPCPACKEAVCIQRIGQQWRCGQCGVQWWADNAIRPDPPPSRDDLLSGRYTSQRNRHFW
jgi:predicted phage terminase large subunit-like protein